MKLIKRNPMMPPLATSRHSLKANKLRGTSSPSPHALKQTHVPAFSPKTDVLQKPPKQRSHKRSISFGGSPLVEPIIHVTDYSPEEISATWYGTEEIKSFKEDRKETAKRVDHGDTSVTDCLRGVEAMTLAGSRTRYENILNGINAVLDEQELQDLDGKENPEMLAHIYWMNTAQCQEAAHKLGLRDQRVVMGSTSSLDSR